ncbi:MAG TPA: peptide MFS transporter [Vicinamibacteria bacterium]
MSDTPDRSGLFGHPRGLSTLFFTELWERFSYYGMRAILMLYMVTPQASGGLGFDTARAAGIYGLYTGSVYFTAIPGGWIADRLLGLRRAVLAGGVLIALGHYCLFGAASSLPLFYAGLLLIICGTGLLKSNVSSIVGELYAQGDPRRDAGFSIFYMGINLGALVSPIICGYLAQKVGWHWGFGAAAFGMTLGLVQFVAGANRLGDAGRLREPPKDAGALWTRIIVVTAAVSLLLWSVWPWRDLVVLTGTVALFAWLVKTGGRTPEETKRIGAIIVLFVFATLFWIGFEQAGSSLTLFAEKHTDNVVLGFDFPSSWYQSVEPIFVVSFAPVFAWLWLTLGKREPSSPAKFAWALLSLGIGFLLVAFAASRFAATGVKVSPWWLIGLYFFHAMGELALSPVGLSTVTKLAPGRIVGLMMGVWFLALSLGNFLGGHVAGFFDRLPLPQLFGSVFLATAGSALLLALLTKPIKNLMSGVR